MPRNLFAVRRSGQKEKTDPAYQSAVAGRLREVRQKIGWTQKDLEAISSVSVSQISKIENGHESPRLNTLKAIAAALGMTPFEFLRIDHDYKVNTDFNIKPKKGKQLGTTKWIKILVEQNYFKSPRSVKNVLDQCQKKFNVILPSADTSGVLLLLVDRSVLKKTRNSGQNLYQKK